MIIDILELKSRNGSLLDYFFQEELGNLENADMLIRKEDQSTPVNVKVYAYFTDDKVYISGELKTWVTAYCSRCLAPFKQEVGGEFWEEFQVGEPVMEEEKHEDELLLSREAANNLEIKGNYLDLREYIRQLFIVFQEWKPLCDPQCKGLCSECGINLNEKDCACIRKTVDPRLAPLQELKKETN